MGAYVLDFFCPAARLAVELDGEVHRDPLRAASDAERERWLREAEGIRVVRFENERVWRDFDRVVDGIRMALSESV